MIVCAGGRLVASARAAALVQDFYLPMPESQIYQANSAIISGTGSTMASTFSILVTGDGTVIYYDQWEDGYETDLSNPTQPTTQIWGDGNDAHGIPPGFAHNPLGLPAGTVITLTNNVSQPRNPSTIQWDARDHIASTKALVITRAAWPVNPGPVFAGAVGVLSTMDYGTNYISPVGQDLTNNLFKYVGMFIMAAQNNTAVTIDPNGTGVGTTNIVLNQGESYLVNGGIKKGGRVWASKPVQTDLLIGHVGASYASDWFTLYPVEEWDNTYYTPVGSAATMAQPAYVYLFNPNTNALTINFNTQSGAGSFTVPGTNGVFQFPMPVSSGASFVSASGQNFFAVCTVAANNASDSAYNWGFTLVPKAALTTEADVGWGPGSADGTVDGSPVWVTTFSNTRLYVDYKGDHAGPLTDPNGNHYDTNFDVVALQSQKIYDPSKNQTGMRVYTVDGTLLTAAWGEDADVAASGNPYIDAGTTVLPFPVPVMTKSAVIVTDVPPVGLSIGDTIQYTVQVDNKGLLPLGNLVVIDGPSTNLTYVTNSTTLNGSPIPDSPSGTPFPLDSPGYTIPVILSRGSSSFQYEYTVNSGGVVSNRVNIFGTAIADTTQLPPPPTNGATVSLNFTDTNGIPTGLYAAGANVFVTMTNAAGNTSSNTAQAITITIKDLTDGDVENVLLAETGTNTGVFRNISGLATSTSTGLGQQDGTLNVAPGDTLSVSYIDPNFGDSASNTAAIQIPALTKQLYLSTYGSTNGAQLLTRIDPVAYGRSPTQTSVDIGSAGGNGTITIDTTTYTNSSANATNLNVQHTTSAGANYMLVTVAIFTYTADDPVVSMFYTNTVGKSAQALTKLTSVLSGTSAQGARTEIWGLANPSPTNTFVHITITSSRGLNAGVTTFSGVNVAGGATGNCVSNSATSGTVSSVNVPTTAGQYVVSVAAAVGSPTPAPTLSSIGSGQVNLWTTNATGSDDGTTSCTISNAVKSTTTTMSATWSASVPGWAICAVPLNATPGSGNGPATNAVTFTQTPTFYSTFIMPSNNTIIITNYITVTNGTMPLNPAVTATLKFNGNAFLTLTNPTYSSSPNTNLVWSGILTSNVTVPSGQAISCLISNGQSGTAFHINYDSTNMPSKILLPASTVIAINSLGVYDAPYPNGNLVITPVAGSTLYVRATASDPFGSYDITSLGLAITAPSPSANVATNLTGANVVTNDGYSKTYEFPWTTGPTTGGYSLTATAHEGTEGVVATAGAGISLIFLDLGTPSTTEFTSGSNGTDTNGYPANALVSVRVTDLNRNTNAATIDTILATVSSSSGDSEILTLTETGPNTGIFTNSIISSTGSGAASNDGTLYAPVGSVLTASYSDPTDPTDNTSATATIQPPPGVPGIVINKTLVSPAGGQTGVGNPVVFNLQVVNTGSTVLTNVTVTDTFPSVQLGYSSASLAPTTVGAGTLTWTNVGGLTPGQSTNFTVTFTTLVSGMATNSATANGVTAVNSSSATVLVTHPVLSITKLLLSPTNSPVSIGSNVVFRILIQNVGDTVIPTLPLEDNFSGAYFQYVSATIPPDGTGFGSLIWTNLAGATALATNAIITNDITMTVVGQGNPANNTAVADYAVDSYGNPVPTAAGSTNIVTAAAAISGYVYNDKDQSGTLTAGDAPLSDVTIQLYTDPTGTGTPGTLVQETTTDGSGYYELDNLTLGRYVVVAGDLPGFASTVPANGRLAFNLTSLSTSANNYFFQYQPSLTLYSTLNGTVYNDTNGNGTNNAGESGIAYVPVDLVQDVNSNGVADPGEPVVSSTTTDTNGNYYFAGVTPGHYVIRETDLYGYYSTGDSQPPNDNQINLVTTNGIVSTNNNFFDRLSPVAVNDTNPALYLVPVTLYPLTNDISPNGDPLTITSVFATNGTVTINAGSTNLTFTPTNNSAVATIGYAVADAHGGSSSAVIVVNVLSLADLGVGKTTAAGVLATSNLVYTISVTNFGPSAASGVVVTDSLPAGVSFVSAGNGGVNNSGVVNWNLGTLANGAVSNVTVTVTAPASGTLTNIATVTSPISDPNNTNNTTPPVITTVTTMADVGLGKSAAASVLAASNLVYTISVTNFGPSTASSVVVTDTLPAGVTFVSATGGGINNSGVVNWNLGALTNGAISTITVTVTAPASGTLTNVATVASPTSDPNNTNNTTPPVITTVTTMADVGLGKSAAASVLAASNLVYTISVTNFGPSTASSVVVTDTLPAGVTFVSATGGGVNNSGVVNWNLGALTNGAISNITLTVTAPASGTLTNIATVTSPISDPISTNNTTPPVITTVTPVADVGLGKTAAGSVLAASNLVYTISVTNFGPSIASSVVVTDTLPAGVTFVSATGGGINNSGVVNWNLGALTNGAISNITVTVTAPASGTLTNVATVASPTSDPNNTNNTTPPVITTVTPVADVAVGKSGPAGTTFGTGFSYSISVTNFGPSTATVLSVTDSLPVGLVFAGAIPPANTNAANQVIWNLGNLTAGAATNLMLNVISTSRGTMTNLAAGGSPTLDPVLNNNVSQPVITAITNIPPIANPDSYAVIENTTNTLSPLINDLVETPGGSLTIIGVNPTNGTTTISGTNVIFVPTPDFTGTATVGYIITDNVGGTNASLMTITVTNIPPVANPDHFAITENTTNVFRPLANDSAQISGASLSVISVNPTNGTASIVSSTNVQFTPSANFIGTATIGYTISDGIGGTNSSVITVTVTNIAPLANPDNYGVTENTTNTFSPLLNDLLETPGGALTLIGVNPTNGTASISGTNVIFRPSANFIGMATIGYTISDGIGGTNSSVITVTVTNIAPLANPDNYGVTENTTNTFSPLLNDLLETPGGALTLIGVNPTNGTASISGTNVIFRPSANFIGTATIGYTISDGIGGTNSSVITVTVTNIAPLANPDSATDAENTALTLAPLANDLAPTPGGSLTIIAVNPTNGTASILGGTNVLFTPQTNFIGTATIGYAITDNVGGTNASVITISVTNRPPVANAQSVSTLENEPLPVTLTGTDPNGLPLTFVVVSGPANGALSLLNTNTGMVTYTPNTNYTGADSFTFRVNDGQANSGTATVSLTVSPAADVTVVKTGPTSGIAGSNLTYNITVDNHGPGTASNVAVFDQLPAGFTPVSSVPATATVSNNLVSWPALNLPANAVTNFTVTGLSAAGGTFTNIAFSTATTADPNPTNNNGTATNSQVITTVSTLADIAVFKTGSTNVPAGGTVVYTITVTNAGPSMATNVVVQDALPATVVFQTASGGYSLSNNLVNWPFASLAAGASASYTVTVTAPGAGSFVNVASAVSDTPDPNPTNNNGTASASRVTTSVVPVADVQVFVYGPTNVTLGDAFAYTIVVTNAGPSPAANTLAHDFLPTNLLFTSASGGGVVSNGVVTWPIVPLLVAGQSTNLTVNVAPSLAGSTNRYSYPTNHPLNFTETNVTFLYGTLTNVASAFATTYDPNLTNNNGTLPTEQVQTIITPGVFNVVIDTNTYPTNTVVTNTIVPIGPDLFVVGAGAFNPQTGLYEETVTVTNIGTTVVHALRLYVGGLRSGVTLFNATGTNNGIPYVEYDPPYSSPLYPYPAYTNNNSVTFALEFFVADRRPFTNWLSAVAINPPVTVTTNGTPVLISQVFVDSRSASGARFVFGFDSIPGKTYTIEYSSDLLNWTIAVPSVVASANVTQWYDDGPPKTISKPMSIGYRFYRVIQQ